MDENIILDIDSLESDIIKLPTIRGRHITRLPNMERFVNVKILSIHDTNVTELENLPPNLKVLFCNFNEIKRICNLPNTIRSIFCADNKITEIINLPTKLRMLKCENNLITHLCLLPTGLEILSLDCNRLRKISNLPEGLTSFTCPHNELSDLCILPKSLTYFVSFGNNLPFGSIEGWRTVSNFRSTYFKNRLRWKKFFYNFIRKRKFECHQELIYSPIFPTYKECMDPATRDFFNMN